jgi:UDP-glucose 4-epimerase
MARILVTGGCGYIGSHTIVDLLEKGHEAESVDNFSRSEPSVLERIESITGVRVTNHNIDLNDAASVSRILSGKSFDGIIHFAAFKAVNESVNDPLLYYRNNIGSQVNILEAAERAGISNFIFSSSCSVYGNVREMPVTEDTRLMPAESPYGRSKQMGEEIIRDLAVVSKMNFIMLRYFNPAGAHPSGKLGEIPYGKPSNLVPAITQFAAGKLESLHVFGTDYETRDGSCIRDFVHVCDIASAHTLALEYLFANKNQSNLELYNLGTGNGVTVFECIRAFEKISGKPLPVIKSPRRTGDVVAIYSDCRRASRQLAWKPRYDVHDIMRTAWAWERQYQA